MSIIHDALKKVQQTLAPQTRQAPAAPSGIAPKDPAYIFGAPPAVETLTETVEKAPRQKPPVKNKILSLFATACIVLITSAITIASINYIYQQYQNDIPTVKNFAKKSFNRLIHKEEPLAFETKAPKDRKPLGTFTINPSAGSAITKPPAPTTLNIHGVMSNGSNNLVLINDQVYQEGDEVDGAKIVKINLDSITVNINGTEQTIPVKN